MTAYHDYELQLFAVLMFGLLSCCFQTEGDASRKAQ
jgi:hypothetical protein